MNDYFLFTIDQLINGYNEGFESTQLYTGDSMLLAKLGKLTERMNQLGFSIRFSVEYVEDIEDYCMYIHMKKLS